MWYDTILTGDVRSRPRNKSSKFYTITSVLSRPTTRWGIISRPPSFKRHDLVNIRFIYMKISGNYASPCSRPTEVACIIAPGMPSKFSIFHALIAASLRKFLSISFFFYHNLVIVRLCRCLTHYFCVASINSKPELNDPDDQLAPVLSRSWLP